MARQHNLGFGLVQQLGHATQKLAHVVLHVRTTGIEHGPALVVHNLDAQPVVGDIHAQLVFHRTELGVGLHRRLHQTRNLAHACGFLVHHIVAQRLQVDRFFGSIDIALAVVASGAREFRAAPFDDAGAVARAGAARQGHFQRALKIGCDSLQIALGSGTEQPH